MKLKRLFRLPAVILVSALCLIVPLHLIVPAPALGRPAPAAAHPATAARAGSPVAVKTVQVSGCTVAMISADLSNPRLELRPVLAGGKTGCTAELAAMARSAGAVAAVNGTFFNAYSDMTPWGTIVIDGEMHRAAGDGGAVIVAPDNRVSFARLEVEIKGGINGSEEWPNNWYAWDVNRNFPDPQAIVIFTPSFGQVMREPAATTVVVRRGRVVSVQPGPVPIPQDGYVIGFGPGAGQIAERFRVGDTVQVRFIFRDRGANTLIPSRGVRHILQAGPLLVRNGANVAHLSRDAWRDPKFFLKSSRSFCGADRNGRLVLGTACGVTMDGLAEVLVKLGLSDAFALDGGASAGLYCQGRYLVRPGRKLSNCLALIVHPEPRVPIRLRGEDLQVPGFLKPPGVTMVPLRGIFECLGAEVGWNQASQEIVIALGERSIVLRCGSRSAFAAGKKVELPLPPEIRGGKTFVPLRFVVESLGLKVVWDEAAQRVDLY